MCSLESFHHHRLFHITFIILIKREIHKLILTYSLVTIIDWSPFVSLCGPTQRQRSAARPPNPQKKDLRPYQD